MRKAMSNKVGAGGRLDIFLDSALDVIPYLYLCLASRISVVTTLFQNR